MRMAVDLAAAAVVAVAGTIVGLASAFFYIVLELPVRVHDGLGAGLNGSGRRSGWALFIGMTVATLASGADLSLRLARGIVTDAFFALILLACGIFTGMIAAGLSEILDVLPHTMVTFHLEQEERPLMAAVLIGKVLGAFLALLLQI